MVWRINAPAKLNIYLRVLGKREDGYHEIVSIMVPVSLFDIIEIQKTDERGGVDLLCTSQDVPSGEDNLVFRAVKLFLKRADIRQGLKVTLNKRIPIGAGLGGGSSDAGSSLILLSRIFNRPLSIEQLKEMAEELGSDVPFFLYRRPCIVRGRGEKVEPIEKWPLNYYVIVKPPFHVYTRFIYERHKIKLTNNKKKDIINCLKIDNDFNILDFFVNDLEATAISFFPAVEELKKRLLEVGARRALMTGSGPSVFGVFESEEEALRAKQRLISQNLGEVHMVTEIIDNI